MGYAKYVGRVGALAVALGIGAAVASTSGVAWAQDGEGGGSPVSDTTGETTGNPTSETPGENGGGGGADPGDASGQPNGEVKQESTGTTGVTTTTGGGGPVVTVRSSGGSLTSRIIRQLFEGAPRADQTRRPGTAAPQAAPAQVEQQGARYEQGSRVVPQLVGGENETPSLRQGPDGHAGQMLMADDEHVHVPVTPESVWQEILNGPEGAHERRMLNSHIAQLLLPGIFLDDMGLPNALSDLITGPMEHEGHGGAHERRMRNALMAQDLFPTIFLNENNQPNAMSRLITGPMGGAGGGNGEGHGSHGSGGGVMAMDCEGGMDMAGMDMGCDSMDHAMTPMMLVTAQGAVKPAATPGHDMGSMSMPGHDMGSTPAEAMPGHDMSSMPAGSAPTGHDMSSMPPAGSGHTGHDMPPAGSGHPGHEMPDAGGGHAAVKGLVDSQDGYTFVPHSRELGDNFAFTITGPGGLPVEDYEVLHDRDLHLIVASRDLQQYAHLHPTRDAKGQWSVPLSALPSGDYRMFADFKPVNAEEYTLGVDVTRPGPVPVATPLVPRVTDVVDGLEVTLDVQGGEAVITTRRDGKVVTTEPYLGAAGHLVALRNGDLAYLHVHPLDDTPNGPVRFAVDLPSAGTYALFFDFKVDGVVRTARFVVEEP